MTLGSRAFIVVDLGFGDAGKGLMTDYLVRSQGAHSVVRFNGGAQAGHNVVTDDGRHHTFSQLGSGSFLPGVRTHLASEVVIHPTALRVEAEHLARNGVTDALARCSIDPRCRVTTPFQQSANRLRELLRASEAHGSCGIGVGETVRDSLECPELTLRFADLVRPERARDRLHGQAAAKLAELEPLLGDSPSESMRRELDALRDPTLPDRWLAAAAEVARSVRAVESESLGTESGAVVFEGAQGVLLDEQFGFYPHVSYSRCRFDGALELLAGWQNAGSVQRIGVLRSYAVRHGPGPFPTEDGAVSAATRELHNTSGPWQKHVRKGWLDLVLLDYALRACGGVDALALTHIDALATLPDYRVCFSYGGAEALALPRDVAQQERLARSLGSVEPHYRSLPGATAVDQANELRAVLAQVADAPVRFDSRGPTARDVSER